MNAGLVSFFEYSFAFFFLILRVILLPYMFYGLYFDSEFMALGNIVILPFVCVIAIQYYWAFLIIKKVTGNDEQGGRKETEKKSNKTK